MKRVVVCILLLVCSQLTLAQQRAPSLDSLKALLGRWVGEGTSEVGAGGGSCSFELSLKDRVLVRKNHAEYPATKERPTITHDDLMIVYPDTRGNQLRGFYTDSEGNTINYLISVSTDGKTIVFLSDPSDAGPRYRLTYTFVEADRLSLTFELAPADQPEQFKKFIGGQIHRVK